MITAASLKRYFSQLRSDLRKVKGTADLVASLPGFFRDRITVDQAREEIKRALDSREQRFLEVVRTQVYDRRTSPYRRLLKLAGCEFADLEADVRHHGLEKTLERLAEEGVYLTSDEFKGKKEVVRGRARFRVSPKDFEPSKVSSGFVIQSSGTRNEPVRSGISLEWLMLRSIAVAVFFSAHDLLSRSHAVYEGVLPGSAGVNNLLSYAKFGISAERWFARRIPINTWLEGRYHDAMTSLIVGMGKWFGPGFPKPELIDITDIHKIVSWVSDKQRERKNCCISSTASNAARIAQVAWEMGQSLEGLKFNVSGEPLTDGKLEAIERVRATVTSRFSYGGSVNAGYGCANPVNTDENHINQYTFALIKHPKPLTCEGPAIHPLLLTTLYSNAPRLHLNVANGDYAELSSRNCGCKLQKIGFTLHLHDIRSYEKLTSEGMNYFYGDLFMLLEKALPAEFGGGPGDYQLLEEEDNKGQTRVTLLAHPGVGSLDEDRVLDRLRVALANGSRGNRFMSSVWKHAGTFKLRREMPYASPRGKILPLHISQAKKSYDAMKRSPAALIRSAHGGRPCSAQSARYRIGKHIVGRCLPASPNF